MTNLDQLSFLPATMRADTARDCAEPRFLAHWAELEAMAISVPATRALVSASVPTAELRIARVYEGSELVGVWPFRIEGLGPLRIAVRAGGSVQVYDGPTLHPAVEPVATTARLWAEVTGWNDVDLVYLPAFLPGAPVQSVPAVQAAAIPHGRTARLRLSGLPDVQTLIARQPKHRRKTIRRRRRALQRRGTVCAAVLHDPTERLEAVQWALATKIAWLDSQDALGATVRSVRFARTLERLAESPVGMVVHRLKVGDQIAAVELGFADGTAYHSYLGTYAPDFAREGAGVALTLEAIDWCIGQGLQTYDLLAPLTDFKKTWADHQRTISAAVVPTSLKGRLAAPLFRNSRDRLKQLVERLPAPIRDRLTRHVGAR